METERMGQCVRSAWEYAVEEHRKSTVSRPAVTTAHLLLGVLKEESCAGGLILAKLGLDIQLARGITEFLLLHSRRRAGAEEGTAEWGGVTHTIAARKVLDLALEEANLYSATYPIGTEHLLLGLLRVPESLGFRILGYFGVEEARVRAARGDLWELLRSPE